MWLCSETIVSEKVEQGSTFEHHASHFTVFQRRNNGVDEGLTSLNSFSQSFSVVHLSVTEVHIGHLSLLTMPE